MAIVLLIGCLCIRIIYQIKAFSVKDFIFKSAERKEERCKVSDLVEQRMLFLCSALLNLYFSLVCLSLDDYPTTQTTETMGLIMQKKCYTKKMQIICKKWYAKKKITSLINQREGVNIISFNKINLMQCKKVN
jgi:hypothetical protein